VHPLYLVAINVGRPNSRDLTTQQRSIGETTGRRVDTNFGLVAGVHVWPLKYSRRCIKVTTAFVSTRAFEFVIERAKVRSAYRPRQSQSYAECCLIA